MNREHGPENMQQPIWLYWAAWLLSISLGLRYFSYLTADPDLWGHIRFGEQVWRLGALEHIDPYAFTSSGTGWVNHEWLTELIFFGVYRMAGDWGLLAGKLLVGVAVVCMLILTCRLRGQHPILFVLIALPAIASIAPGFMIRPQLFTYLLFTAYMLILHLFFFKNKNYLWLVPGLMAFWVNLHGGFLMGIAVVGAVVGWLTCEAMVTRQRRDRLLPLWITLATTVLASFANPYGYKLHAFLYQSLKIERAISEWEPVTLLDGSFPAFKLLMILFILSIGALRKKGFTWETVSLGFLLYAAIRHQRHIPFFAIMVTPYLICQGTRAMALLKQRFPRLALSRASLVIIALAFVVLGGQQAAAGIGKNLQAGWRIIVDPKVYPVAAVRFMQDNAFKGNLQLVFEWGEYAIWKLYPACRVSIDGRFRTTYPESVIQDHFKAREAPGRIFKLAEKYGADIILTKQSPAVISAIHKRDPDWLYVYSDPVAVIFLRQHPRNADRIRAFNDKGFVYRKDAPSSFFP